MATRRTSKSAQGQTQADEKASINSPETKSLDYGSDDEYDENPFSDPKIAAHYRLVYEKAQYEGRHEFDPDLQWSKEEERRVVRKMDWRVCTWACIMWFVLQIDKGNLSQALSDNMLDDVGLNTDDYNLGNLVFLLSFLFCEMPFQLLSKKVGYDRLIPAQMTLWSLVAACQFLITNRAGFLVTRALLGMLEGGFGAELMVWLSYFYTSRDLPLRLSFFFTALSVTSIGTSLAAVGILKMRGVLGYAGWRWLFLIEGLVTICIGITTFFYMPPSAVQTKTWFRPRGWFTDREVRIIVNRILRDDPSKGDMHNRQGINLRLFWNALKDYHLWPIYAIGLVAHMPQTPPAQYLTLTLRHLGFNTTTTILLTIPSAVVHMITLLGITWISEKYDSRAMVAVWQSIWTLPCIIALRFWPGTMTDPWGTYALVTTLLAVPFCHAILASWLSKNANNVGTRSVAMALYSMAVQLGNIMATTIYRDYDKPLYKSGNMDLLAINILAIVLFCFAKWYYVTQNKRRDRVWGAMTEAQRDAYRDTSKDQGSCRLDFRFAH